MTYQNTYCVITKCMVPIQQLLESVVLVTIVVTSGTTLITLTVTNLCTVVRTVFRVTQVQVTLYTECEVLQELDVHVCHSLHSVTDSHVRANFVFPNHVTVSILVTSQMCNAVVVCIRTTVVLLVAIAVQTVCTVCIVQVYRIDRSDVTAVHKCVGIRTV